MRLEQSDLGFWVVLLLKGSCPLVAGFLRVTVQASTPRLRVYKIRHLGTRISAQRDAMMRYAASGLRQASIGMRAWAARVAEEGVVRQDGDHQAGYVHNRPQVCYLASRYHIVHC